MATVADGGINDYKLNPYQQESQKIIKEYENDNQAIKLDDYLKSCANNLKKLNLIKTRKEIEFIRYNCTGGYPSYLENNIIEQKLKFFSSIIGFMDGAKDNYTRNIDFLTLFSSSYQHQNKIEFNKRQQLRLEEMRKKILIDFDEIHIKEEPKILLEVLTTNPVYQSFPMLYSYFAKNPISYNYQAMLTIAYGIGYKNAHYIIQDDNSKEIFGLYQELYEEIKNYQVSLQSSLDKEKNKIFSKK